MPDRRRHRGPHPEDPRLFADSALPNLRQAVEDLAWLEGRGYAEKASLEIVGNRFQLCDRQRKAVLRAACSDHARETRSSKRVDLERIAPGSRLDVDAYNVLITVESALSSGVVLVSRDGVYRDIASIHGTYRRVDETVPAILAIGETLACVDDLVVDWLIDAPVSNSGRLRALLEELAREHSWAWSAELVPSPDPVLAASKNLVASSDSLILDSCDRWLNLAKEVVARHAPNAWRVDLSAR